MDLVQEKVSDLIEFPMYIAIVKINFCIINHAIMLVHVLHDFVSSILYGGNACSISLHAICMACDYSLSIDEIL